MSRRNGIFRRVTRQRRDRISLPPRVPISVDLDLLDVTVELPAVTPENTVVEYVSLLDITVELPAITVEQPQPVIVDLDPIDITTQVLAIDGEKVADLTPIDITIELPTALALRGYALPLIDIQTELPSLIIIQTSYDIEAIDIVTVPQSVDVGYIYDLSPIDVDVTTSNMGVNPQKIVDVDPIDITTEVTFVQVIQTAYAIDPIDITVSTTGQSIDVAYEHEIPLVDITVSTDSQTVETDHAVNVPPIDITTQLPTVITYQSWRLGIIDVTTQLPAVDPASLVDTPAVDITIQFPVVDPAHVIDLQLIDVQVVAQPTSTQAFNDDPIQIEVEVLPVEAGFSVEQFSLIRGLPAQPVISPTRIIAQSILTKEFLHWELPVSNIQVTYALSGPNTISGEFTNEILDLRDAGLEPWGTWIHVEEDGFIRASGILMPTSLDQNEKLSLEAVGFSSYPAGMPYTAQYSGIAVDPADIVRHLWAHLQSFPDGNLGVTVVGTTSKKIGDPVPPPDENGNIPTDTGPYKLDWWEATDCGSEISNLAQETPFDFVERSEWNATKTDVLHYIDIGYPRIGTRRYDLRFAQDENLLTAVGPEEVEGFYASSVILMGKGEGSTIVRGYAGRPSTKRIRRVVVMDDGTVDNVTRANSLCAVELERRQAILDIREVEIDARHPNARLGSFRAGDDILLDVDVPWIGKIRQWERVTSYTYSPETDSIRVEMQRAESFSYGSTDPVPLVPPEPVLPAVPVGPTQEFLGDFSTGNFSQYSNIQNVVRNGSASGYDQSHYSARVEAAGTGHPNAFRCEVRGGDVALGVGGSRCEIRTSSTLNWEEGDERWFEFSIKFHESFPTPGPSTSWCIPLQFHAGTGSPPVCLNIPQSGQYAGTLTLENHAISLPVLPVGPLDKGKWVDYVLHVKFSNDATIGFVEMWRNKIKVVNKTFRKTMNSAENYLKVGLYRDTDETGTMILYHDSMRITKP